MGNLEGLRRVVALGDMLELGTDSDQAHQEVADMDLLIMTFVKYSCLVSVCFLRRRNSGA